MFLPHLANIAVAFDHRHLARPDCVVCRRVTLTLKVGAVIGDRASAGLSN